MNHVVFLAWRYLKYYWVKTIILVIAISLIVFIPFGLREVVDQASDMLTARAESTPLLIGAKGSALDLTLSSLYFRTPNFDPLPYREIASVNNTALASAVPLHLRYLASGYRIVGTTTEYFEFRDLLIEQGRFMAILGECVLGASAAAALNLSPDDFILSSPAGAFDVAGSYPLKMRVVGVLSAIGTPDDEAIFVDIKTAWVISGLAHGHMDMNTSEAESGILEREEGNVVANASVLSYTEITPENINSFHFHGNPDAFPIDAVIAVPRNRRSAVMLRGRYEERSDPVQMLVPARIVGELIDTVLSVRNFVIMGSIGVGIVTLAIVVLVFMLSIRLRRREIETIQKIGGTGRRLNAILAAEILMVVAVSVGISAVLVLMVRSYGLSITNFFVR
jgi:putative ABC transport system permease protein